MDQTKRPDMLSCRSSRRSLLRDDDHAAHFIRRLNSFLRNPVTDFSKVVSAESKAPRPIGDDSEGHITFRVATWFLVALRRLFLLERWLVFLAEHPDLELIRATKQFVALMRRRGVRTSKSTLYKHSEEFERGGLMALLPRYGGGRPRRIPAADRELIQAIYWGTNRYALYLHARSGKGLPGGPVSRSSALRAEKVRSVAQGRKSTVRRKPVAPQRNPRAMFEDAA